MPPWRVATTVLRRGHAWQAWSMLPACWACAVVMAMPHQSGKMEADREIPDIVAVWRQLWPSPSSAWNAWHCFLFCLISGTIWRDRDGCRDWITQEVKNSRCGTRTNACSLMAESAPQRLQRLLHYKEPKKKLSLLSFLQNSSLIYATLIHNHNFTPFIFIILFF